MINLTLLNESSTVSGSNLVHEVLYSTLVIILSFINLKYMTF